MRWVTKRAEIEADQFTGKPNPDPPGVCRCGATGYREDGDGHPHVHTIHQGQVVELRPGDWIIAENDGEHFYPCKPDVFHAKYEPASMHD